MKKLSLIALVFLSCAPDVTPRSVYCEAAQRRATQCGIRYPVPNHCLRGHREIGDVDEMSCSEIEERINALGYLW